MPTKNNKPQPSWMTRVYDEPDLLVRHATRWWTMDNLAIMSAHGKDPATTSYNQVGGEIDDDSLEGEQRAWARVARKSLEIVMKKKMPLTLSSMETASFDKAAVNAYVSRR